MKNVYFIDQIDYIHRYEKTKKVLALIFANLQVPMDGV